MIPSDPSAREGQRVDEWSIVRHDEGEEVITMRLESSTAFDRAALILPVPARAEFALGHDAQFDAMAERTEPKVVVKERRTLFGGDEDDDDGGALDGAAPAGAGAVEVVDSQDLGPLRIVTLRGDDAGVVRTWLTDQGFETPDGLEPLAQEYLDRGWLLVAVRLRAAGDRPLQRLQPLIVRFASEEVVYPLRMSALAEAPVEARVDVVAHAPMALGGGWPNRDLEAPTTRGSGRLFAGPEPNDRYLSSFRLVVDGDDFEDPRFVPAKRDDFRQTITRYEDVDVTGQAAIALLAAIAVAAMVVVGLRRRRVRSA